MEMEMKKLKMGTLSYSSESMDEAIHQLAVGFGYSGERGSVVPGTYQVVGGTVR